MDTVGHFLTRIRNAGAAHHKKLDVPSSKMKESIAKVLKDAGYIVGFRVAKAKAHQLMRVYLKYDKEGKHVISNIQRVSCPSCRRYTGTVDIPEVRSGYGLVVLSTSSGILSGKEAKKKNIGGEVLFQVW